MFSTLWYASSRLRSCCPSANATPSTALATPSAATTHPAAAGTGSQPLNRTKP